MVGCRDYPLSVGKNRYHPTVYFCTQPSTWAASYSWNEISFRESKTGHFFVPTRRSNAIKLSQANTQDSSFFEEKLKPRILPNLVV